MKNKVRVLLVDSDIEQLRSIEKYFSSHAVIDVVKTFNDGVVASDYIKSHINDFDIVVMDIILPNKDGISIIRNIRDKSLEKGIVVLTGYNSLDLVKQVNLLNVNYFMLKPISLRDLEYQLLNIDTRKLSILDYNKGLERDISDLLHLLGVPSHVKGYVYII